MALQYTSTMSSFQSPVLLTHTHTHVKNKLYIYNPHIAIVSPIIQLFNIQKKNNSTYNPSS